MGIIYQEEEHPALRQPQDTLQTCFTQKLPGSHNVQKGHRISPRNKVVWGRGSDVFFFTQVVSRVSFLTQTCKLQHKAPELSWHLSLRKKKAEPISDSFREEQLVRQKERRDYSKAEPTQR